MTQRTEARSGTGLFSLKRIKQLYDTVLDLVFPPTCIHCGRVDSGFCEWCYGDLAAEPIMDYTTTTQSGIVVASTGVHRGILQSAVQALKYYNQPQLGVPLGERLATAFSHLNWTIDTIIPVPLHITRYHERGYNQAQEIANALAESLHIPCEPEAIERTRITHSQVGLNREERLSNLNDAFTAHAEYVTDKKILLVDDVQTTGTTISMCAEAAMQAGAAKVYGITVTAATIVSS